MRERLSIADFKNAGIIKKFAGLSLPHRFFLLTKTG
jgi:hypothetical protein